MKSEAVDRWLLAKGQRLMAKSYKINYSVIQLFNIHEIQDKTYTGIVGDFDGGL